MGIRDGTGDARDPLRLRKVVYVTAGRRLENVHMSYVDMVVTLYRGSLSSIAL